MLHPAQIAQLGLGPLLLEHNRRPPAQIAQRAHGLLKVLVVVWIVQPEHGHQLKARWVVSSATQELGRLCSAPPSKLLVSIVLPVHTPNFLLLLWIVHALTVWKVPGHLQGQMHVQIAAEVPIQ